MNEWISLQQNRIQKEWKLEAIEPVNVKKKSSIPVYSARREEKRERKEKEKRKKRKRKGPEEKIHFSFFLK